MRESERAGKREGAIDVGSELPEEAVPCGLCGDPLIEGETGDREPRGSYHAGCIKEARRETLGQPAAHPWEGRFSGRRRHGR